MCQVLIRRGIFRNQRSPVSKSALLRNSASLPSTIITAVRLSAHSVIPNPLSFLVPRLRSNGLGTLLTIVCATAFWQLSPAAHAAPAAADAATALIARVVPAKAASFSVEIISDEKGHDVFEVESKGSKIVLRGNTGVAVASALNWYLQERCHCMISWEGSQLALPETLPPVSEKVRQVSPYQRRAYLNYCVFSYTMAWWDKARWQREIDWMALHGVNMPLQVVGQEATWLATFERLGLSREDMTDFFVGPAYFAWGWMNNVDSIGGPLPDNWIKSHTEMGQWLLAQQRALGMTPVLQGFSGRVPGAFAKKHPDCRIQQIRQWGDLPGTYQMDPTDPLFAKVGRTFIEEETRLFGTDHLYAADPFHEGQPPSTKPEYLAEVGKNIFETMTAADPKAMWVMQSWSLREPILKAAPEDRLIVFDLNGGRSFGKEPFWGRSTVWGVLNNYGGRHYMSGPVATLLKRHELGADRAANLTGFGLFDEATELNPIVVDALYDSAWNATAPDPTEWTHDWAARRYGADLESSHRAWDLLLKTVYTGVRGYDSALRARPALHLEASSPCAGSVRFGYDNTQLCKAWAALLEGADKLQKAPGYRYDVANLGEQTLNNYGLSLQHRLTAAFEAGDRKAFETTAAEIHDLILDLDRLTGTHEMFLLGKWIADARAQGTTDEEKDLYEANARALVTVWEVKKAAYFDYSARSWSGLYRDYYLPRWEKFFAFLRTKLDAGETSYRDDKVTRRWGRPTLSASDFYAQLDAWERSFAQKRDHYSPTPIGDLIAEATKLVAKYQPKIEEAAKAPATEESTAPAVVKKANLTSGKKVTTNGGEETGHLPEYAVDGEVSLNKYWAARPGPAEGRWLQVDLGEEASIRGAHVWPYWDGQRRYEYAIETSTDGLVWQKVADSSTNAGPETEHGREHLFAPVSVRFVRIRMTKNSANPTLHLVEFWVLPADTK